MLLIGTRCDERGRHQVAYSISGVHSYHVADARTPLELGDDRGRGPEQGDDDNDEKAERRDVGTLVLSDIALVGILSLDLDPVLPVVLRRPTDLPPQRPVLFPRHFPTLEFAVLRLVQQLGVALAPNLGEVERADDTVERSSLLFVERGLIDLGSGGLFGSGRRFGSGLGRLGALGLLVSTEREERLFRCGLLLLDNRLCLGLEDRGGGGHERRTASESGGRGRGFEEDVRPLHRGGDELHGVQR